MNAEPERVSAQRTETVLAHLSDIHFGRVDDAVLAALERDIRAVAPDLLVVSGDLTQAARRREFKQARAFLDKLGVPFLAVPGNHDITPYNLLERFIDPYQRWRRYIAESIEPSWHDARVSVIGLNSARVAGWYMDWSRGRLSRRQIAALPQRFAGAGREALRIVVVHHPMLTPQDAKGTTVVMRAALALEALRDSEVDLVLSGHLHRSFIQRAVEHRADLIGADAESTVSAADAGTPEAVAALAPTPAQGGVTVLLAASAASTRIRGEPNGYHLIRVRDGAYGVEHRRWSPEGWHGEPLGLPA